MTDPVQPEFGGGYAGRAAAVVVGGVVDDVVGTGAVVMGAGVAVAGFCGGAMALPESPLVSR